MSQVVYCEVPELNGTLIDNLVQDMSDRIYDTLLEIQQQQIKMTNDVADMKERLFELPCKVNTFKIGLLQKVVYGFVGLILIGFAASFIPSDKIPKSVKSTTAQEQTIIKR
jgi:hypothetical protein